MAAALRRTNNEVKVEMEVEDENAGNPSDDTDIEYNEEEEIELEDDDNDKYLNQPLVPNETFNNVYFSAPSHPIPPPPYDSQGETYRLINDTEEDNSSPIENTPLENGLQNSFRYPRAKRRLNGNPYPRELKKFLATSIFMGLNFLATTVSLSVVHERVPKYEPLPDIILDFFKYQDWGLTASEVLLSIQVATAIMICIFHKHRFIVFRRLFLILGLLYGYRAITMFVTVFPKANPSYHCDPKLSEKGQNLTVAIVLHRAVKILSGFGLSMNGQHVFCGDYLYSGHTMTFVLAYLIIMEYTSKRLYVLHWVAWINAMTGVALLLMGRGHYSIDVIIAYYITSRLWYTYHAMACHPHLKQGTIINYFNRIWWWNFFRWLEENVKTGPLPNGFNLPLPKALCKSLRSRSRTLVNETSRLTRNRQRKYKEEA